jgi:hypothetical protein
MVEHLSSEQKVVGSSPIAVVFCLLLLVLSGYPGVSEINKDPRQIEGCGFEYHPRTFDRDILHFHPSEITN